MGRVIDIFSANHTGWARFSDDMCMRYRLGRALTPVGIVHFTAREEFTDEDCPRIARVVFLMLNPSTADAFKPDPTVSRCCEFARRWGADVLEVVNLFALRSSAPKLLLEQGILRGDDIENDREIIAACAWPNTRIIAAWGNWGALDGRASYVRGLLRERGFDLEALRFAQNGTPMHPMARGKSRIPYDVVPARYAA